MRTPLPEFKRPGTPTASEAVHDRQWLSTLGEVHEFVQEHGRRPTKHATHFEGHLSKWLTTQRKAHREGRLAAWRVEALDTVAPDWNTPRNSTVTWEVTLDRVLEHRAERGQLPDPGSTDKAEAVLGRWVHARLSDWFSVKRASDGRMLGRIPDWFYLSNAERDWYRAVFITVRDCETLGGIGGLPTRELDQAGLVHLPDRYDPVSYEDFRPMVLGWLRRQQTSHLTSFQTQTLNYWLPGWRTV